MHRHFLAAVLLLCNIALFGQKAPSKKDDVDRDINKYLDDGRVGNVSNLVRIRLGRLAGGLAGASYERKFGRKFGLEAGAYFKVSEGLFSQNYRFSEYGSYNYGDKELLKTYGGMALMLYPKLYLSGKKINNGYYFGFRAINQNYKSDLKEHTYVSNNPVQKNVKATTTSFALTAGSHQQFGSRFVFGVEWGFVYVQDVYKKVNVVEYDDATTSNYSKPSNRNLPVSTVDFTFDMSFGVIF